MAVNFQPVTDTSASGASTAASTSTSSINKDLTKDTFLQLLVAQLKNQDPMNPTDGVQFLTQLTQFSQLEQTMQINQQVKDIQSILAGGEPTGGGTATDGTSTSKQV
jgi:flagellar basal-body rod modification protein FlgD